MICNGGVFMFKDLLENIVFRDPGPEPSISVSESEDEVTLGSILESIFWWL